MEHWDLYTDEFINTHNTILSSEEIPNGYYHIALELWIVNDQHEVLLLKNTLDYSKRYPGSWCCIGGNLCTGETKDEAVRRIVQEKIGISINLSNIYMFSPVKRDPYKYAYITYIIFDNIDLNTINFKDNNSLEAKFVNKKELQNMCNNGEIAYYLISRINNQVMEYLDE